MWRAVFLASGIMLIVLGFEAMFVEQVEVRELRQKPAVSVAGIESPFRNASFVEPPSGVVRTKTYRPPDWMPWSLMAAGTIVVLYTYSLPGRKESA
jgi:hypothetical protein